MFKDYLLKKVSRYRQKGNHLLNTFPFGGKKKTQHDGFVF